MIPAAVAVLNAFTEDNCLHDWKHNHHNLDALAAALYCAADWVDDRDTERLLMQIAYELSTLYSQNHALLEEAT